MYASCSSRYGGGISMLTFWPITSRSAYPNSRWAAGLNDSMRPWLSMTTMPSTAESTIDRQRASLVRRRSSSCARSSADDGLMERGGPWGPASSVSRMRPPVYKRRPQRHAGRHDDGDRRQQQRENETE